jgi:hypothetical protein
MGAPAIIVGNLSKKHRTGLREERHTTLPEAIMRALKAPLRRRLAEEHPLPGNSMAAPGQMPAQGRTSSGPRDVEAPVR